MQSQAQPRGKGGVGSDSARGRGCARRGRVGTRSCSPGTGWGAFPGGRAPGSGFRAPQRQALSSRVRGSRGAGVAGGALRSHHPLRPQAPPLAPPLSPPPSPSCPPARPVRSPGPRRAGSLVWPAEAERDPSEPWRPPTRDKRGSREPALPAAAASSPSSRGRSGPRRPGRDSPPLPPGKSSALLRERASRRGPLPRGSGLEEEAAAEAEGSARHSREESCTSRLRLWLPVA